MSKSGPTDIPLMRRAHDMRGLYRKPGKPAGTFFSLTRLSEDGRHAYGWLSDGRGNAIAGTPLTKLKLDAAGDCPEGFVRVKP